MKWHIVCEIISMVDGFTAYSQWQTKLLHFVSHNHVKCIKKMCSPHPPYKHAWVYSLSLTKEILFIFVVLVSKLVHPHQSTGSYVSQSKIHSFISITHPLHLNCIQKAFLIPPTSLTLFQTLMMVAMFVLGRVLMTSRHAPLQPYKRFPATLPPTLHHWY